MGLVALGRLRAAGGGGIGVAVSENLLDFKVCCVTCVQENVLTTYHASDMLLKTRGMKHSISLSLTTKV